VQAKVLLTFIPLPPETGEPKIKNLRGVSEIFFALLLLEIQALHNLIAEELAAQNHYAATAQQDNDNHADDHARVLLLRGLVRWISHGVIHILFSSYYMFGWRQLANT